MTLTLRDEAYFKTLLSTSLLMEPKPTYVFDQFVSKDIDFSKTKGDTIDINRYPYFGDVGMTQIQRQLSEQNTIGILDPVNITTQKVTVTLQEYSGPYNPNANRIAPLGVTEKVARRAQQKLIDSGDPTSFINSIGGNLLKDDLDRWHDRVLCQLYLTSPNSTNPSSKANNTVTATDKFGTDDLLTIREKLMTRNAPTWGDGTYLAIISPRMEKHLMQDSAYREAVRYGAYERLYRGELGNYEGFKFITTTNLPTETVNGLTGHLGIFTGPEAVGYGEGMAPEVRRNKNDDYERFIYLIWLMYRAYTALDTRFVEVGRTYAP